MPGSDFGLLIPMDGRITLLSVLSAYPLPTGTLALNVLVDGSQITGSTAVVEAGSRSAIAEMEVSVLATTVPTLEVFPSEKVSRSQKTSPSGKKKGNDKNRAMVTVHVVAT